MPPFAIVTTGVRSTAVRAAEPGAPPVCIGLAVSGILSSCCSRVSPPPSRCQVRVEFDQPWLLYANSTQSPITLAVVFAAGGNAAPTAQDTSDPDSEQVRP